MSEFGTRVYCAHSQQVHEHPQTKDSITHTPMKASIRKEPNQLVKAMDEIPVPSPTYTRRLAAISTGA